MPWTIPIPFVVVAALCFLSSTDWVGGVRVEVQNWLFDLIGVKNGSGSLARAVIPTLPHFALFGLLGYVAAIEPRDTVRRLLFVVAFAVAVAAEVVQLLTKTRGFTFADMAINIFSVAAVFLLTAMLRSRPGLAGNP